MRSAISTYTQIAKMRSRSWLVSSAVPTLPLYFLRLETMSNTRSATMPQSLEGADSAVFTRATLC